jgi:hypothetical protein
MSDLPECCTCLPGAERAETLYCAYQRGGDPERAGLSWNGLPCPTWAQLVERAESGDAGSAGVVAKWRAVAKNVEDGLAFVRSMYGEAEEHVADLITRE